MARCSGRSSRRRSPTTTASRPSSTTRPRSASSGRPAPGRRSSSFNTPTNPFHTDPRLRIEPAAPGSGVEFRVDGLDPRDAPLDVFKAFDGFSSTWAEYVRLALREGLFGWQVTDCVVTLTEIRVQPRRRPTVHAAGRCRTARRPQEADAARADTGARARGLHGLRARLPGLRRGTDGGDRGRTGRVRPARRRPARRRNGASSRCSRRCCRPPASRSSAAGSPA